MRAPAQHLVVDDRYQPRHGLAYGISLSLFAPMVGTLLMAPAYAVAVVGLSVRSLNAKSDSGANGNNR